MYLCLPEDPTNAEVQEKKPKPPKKERVPNSSTKRCGFCSGCTAPKCGVCEPCLSRSAGKKGRCEMRSCVNNSSHIIAPRPK